MDWEEKTFWMLTTSKIKRDWIFSNFDETYILDLDEEWLDNNNSDYE